MDLDKIKEVWKDTDIKSSLSEDKICKMLGNKGKSALSRLIMYETISLCVLPFLTFLPFVYNHFFKSTSYPLFSICLFVGFCVVAFFWEIFKLRLLKKIDPNNMDILLGSKYMTRYRKYVHYELIVGLCWLIVFTVTYSLTFTHHFSDTSLIFFILYIAFLLVVAILLIVFIYRWAYSKNIRNIEQSIKEIEEFEKDNIE